MSNLEPLQAPVRLESKHERGTFDCNIASLNDFLKKYALQNQKKGAAVTYVATRGKRVVGYYTLAYGAIAFEAATEDIKKGLGKYPIPVMLLARLAVDVSEKGTGLGKALLKDALSRTLKALDIAGLRAVLVHAKDDAAKAFYEHYGFQSSATKPYHLMLKLDDLKAVLA
jgi:predicted N-acetyltransferase YhbS